MMALQYRWQSFIGLLNGFENALLTNEENDQTVFLSSPKRKQGIKHCTQALKIEAGGMMELFKKFSRGSGGGIGACTMEKAAKRLKREQDCEERVAGSLPRHRNVVQQAADTVRQAQSSSIFQRPQRKATSRRPDLEKEAESSSSQYEKAALNVLAKFPPKNGKEYMPQEVTHLCSVVKKGKSSTCLQRYLIENKLIPLKTPDAIRSLLRRHNKNPSKTPICWGQVGRKPIMPAK